MLAQFDALALIRRIGTLPVEDLRSGHEPFVLQAANELPVFDDERHFVGLAADDGTPRQSAKRSPTWCSIARRRSLVRCGNGSANVGASAEPVFPIVRRTSSDGRDRSDMVELGHELLLASRDWGNVRPSRRGRIHPSVP